MAEQITSVANWVPFRSSAKMLTSKGAQGTRVPIRIEKNSNILEALSYCSIALGQTSPVKGSQGLARKNNNYNLECVRMNPVLNHGVLLTFQIAYRQVIS
ncbi:hypothetical protein CDAR_122371 [Caerostris darwini]|uniref:Uncharacterized protein n=1 Tax=Caerostris darwini TaxID=1538125 RepID=A0AAV4T9Z5_9ARAC|nr:hypothetical protein CDAR_122371 [Caerostris darwini]